MLPNIWPELNNLTESLALKGELQRAGINNSTAAYDKLIYRPRSELQRVISSRSIYGISSRLDLIYLRSEIETYTKSLPDSVTRYLLGNRFPYLRALIPLYKMPSWSPGGTIFLISLKFCLDLSFYETVAPAYDLG